MNDLIEKAAFAVNSQDSWWNIYGFLKRNTSNLEEFNLVAQEARKIFLEKKVEKHK